MFRVECFDRSLTDRQIKIEVGKGQNANASVSIHLRLDPASSVNEQRHSQYEKLPVQRFSISRAHVMMCPVSKIVNEGYITLAQNKMS
jgi:hypothetical protein